VADVRAAVTDTHALVFHVAGRWGGKGAKARALFEGCERREALIYVPAAVIWECGLLARVGKIRLQRPLRQLFEGLFSNPAYQPLDLTPEQVYLADEARPNRDPFDALICAAARILDLPLLTRDEDIRGSGLVKVVW
jgi:PIN domain nuclease of toxin-antitoxin system